jgi:putative transposase
MKNSHMPAEEYSSERDGHIRDAFLLLADETRLDIIEHLRCADDSPVPYADLKNELAIHDSGRFNYHLGKLTGVLDAHWSVKANAKTHNFWAFCRFVDRLTCVADEYSIHVEEQPETDTIRECPVCGEKIETVRSGDDFWCPCGHEAHADLDASSKFLAQCSGHLTRPMARPARFEWDDHDWSESPRSHDSPKESRANLKVASVGTA